jgi:hypothetical protein
MKWQRREWRGVHVVVGQDVKGGVFEGRAKGEKKLGSKVVVDGRGIG